MSDHWLGDVGIRVTDLARSLEFYTKVLGLEEIDRGGDEDIYVLLRDPRSRQLGMRPALDGVYPGPDDEASGLDASGAPWMTMLQVRTHLGSPWMEGLQPGSLPGEGWTEAVQVRPSRSGSGRSPSRLGWSSG